MNDRKHHKSGIDSRAVLIRISRENGHWQDYPDRAFPTPYGLSASVIAYILRFSLKNALYILVCQASIPVDSGVVFECPNSFLITNTLYIHPMTHIIKK